MRNQRIKPNLNDDTIVLLIDFFAVKRKDKSSINPLTASVIEKLNSPEVVGALIGIYNSPSFHNDKYWYNRRNLYNGSIFKNKNPYNPGIKYDSPACPMIKYWRPGYNKIISPGYTIEDVRDLLNHLPNVKNILVTGEAWEMCMRTRGFGFLALIPFLKEKKYNLLIDTKIIGFMGQGFTGESFILENEKVVWEHVEDTTYFLPKKHYDRYLAHYIYRYHNKYPL